MKRMVSENLIAILKDLEAKGLNADNIGKKMYKHILTLDESNFYLVGVIYTTFDTKITNDNITSLLPTYTSILLNAYNGDADVKIINATLNIRENDFIIGGLYMNNGNIEASDNICGDLEYEFDTITDNVFEV